MAWGGGIFVLSMSHCEPQAAHRASVVSLHFEDVLGIWLRRLRGREQPHCPQRRRHDHDTDDDRDKDGEHVARPGSVR